MNVRHCMVVHSYYPIGETRVQRQAMALLSDGYQVDVICLRNRGEAPRETVDGVNVYRLPARRHRGAGLITQLFEYMAFFMLAGWAVTRLHLRRRYRSVQVHNLPDFLVFCTVPTRIAGARVVLDLHDLMPEFMALRIGERHPLVKLVRLVERASCAYADRVITVSEAWKEALIARGVDRHKLAVVMNTADLGLFAPRPSAPNPVGDFHLVYHGTFTHRYGVDLIVEAASIIRDEIPGLKVSLLGDGDLRPEIMSQIERLDLAEVVYVSPAMLEVASLMPALRSAHAGVVPNRSNVFTDGLLPTKLMEYVAMGVPVIAARTPALETYFVDDMLAYFEPGNADDLAKVVLSLATDRARLAELAAHAGSFNEIYNFETATQAYLAVINELWAAHRR